MIIVSVKEGENIERALKHYKHKYNDTDIIRRLRKLQASQKPLDVKRRMAEKACYVQSLRQEELDAQGPSRTALLRACSHENLRVLYAGSLDRQCLYDDDIGHLRRKSPDGGAFYALCTQYYSFVYTERCWALLCRHVRA